ncbi:acyl-CoA synthetase [Desulfosarcina sp. OttesenSCG-928-B08]|nr:acyl-CoA synthetase [Desulfosarcina sp. OttesenSCG-928-B08]
MRSLSETDRSRFDTLNAENIDFLRNRYNRVNRWVIADMIRRTAHHHPDKTALVFGDRSMTYTELEAESNRVANALSALGVKKYDRVAILAHNTIHHVLTWLGCCKIGAVYLAINYLLKGKDVTYCINHSESCVFIIEDALYSLVEEVLDDMPSVRHLIWSDDMAGQNPPNDRFLDFKAWAAGASPAMPDAVLNIEDPCQMTYTSGTESLPKGVIISNQALIAQYMGSIIDGRYDSCDINVNAMPIYHCAQRDVFLNPTFWLGGTNILITPEIGGILKALHTFRATMFFAAPTVWIGMLRHPDFDTFDLSCLKKAYYGASIMPVEIIREMLERLPGVGIYNYYGQTELAPYHTILKAEDAVAKPGSAGKAGLHMETRLEDDNGNPITAPHVHGEICGKGVHAMIMYFKEPEKTEDAMRGGWFHTGDIGVLDEDRYLAVVDRKKDMIKTGGENVSTREVEEVIYMDRRVEEVAVIGVNHEKWVEAVTAVVVPRKGQTITEAEIITLCREHLAPFKVPKKVVFSETMPKTPTGKLLKREMRNIYKTLFT